MGPPPLPILSLPPSLKAIASLFPCADASDNARCIQCCPAVPRSYVIDRASNRVQKFNPSGGFLWSSGPGGLGDGQVRLLVPCCMSCPRTFMRSWLPRQWPAGQLNWANSFIPVSLLLCSSSDRYRHVAMRYISSEAASSAPSLTPLSHLPLPFCSSLKLLAAPCQEQLCMVGSLHLLH